MMNSIYRALTAKETDRAVEQVSKRTKSEKVAYRLLPWSMRRYVERNQPVAFVRSKAFFPDLLLRKEKICIEIDGGYHYKHIRQDEHRDKVFHRHGFIVIRIKNLDTRVNVAFWQRILEGLVKEGTERGDIQPYITELHQMIDEEIQSWTTL